LTTDSGTQNSSDAVKASIERIRELNEQIIESGRKAGASYLDAYERALDTIVRHQEELANATPVEWIQRVIEAQAKFIRDVGESYAATTRELLKK
jgi:hypothetical protein